MHHSEWSRNAITRERAKGIAVGRRSESERDWEWKSSQKGGRREDGAPGEDEAMRERRQYQGAITFNYIIRERHRHFGQG